MKEVQGKPHNGLQLVSMNGHHQAAVNGQNKKCICSIKGMNLIIYTILYNN